MPDVTFIYPVLRDDFVRKSLETLYRFTDPSKFRVIVVDQTIKGIPDLKADMVIRMKNQGFAKAANEGMIHGLRWGTPYVAVVNDDVEFIYGKWWEDLLEEFKTDPRIIAVNPMCPKIAMWGYGMTEGEYLEILPYKESYSQSDIAYLKAGNYNEAEIRSRHPFDIPKSFPFTQRGVVDAFAGWLPVFKREALLEVGLYDERFVWGNGEDYDWMARAYSCAWPIERDVCDPKYHKRAVSTMKSWVYHFWGQSKDRAFELDPRLFEGRESWNRLDLLWPDGMDVWGHRNGIPLKRVPDIYVHIP